MVDSRRLAGHARLVFKIANVILLSRVLYRKSKLLCVLANIALIGHLLITKFIQMQLVPISMPFFLNNILADYDEMLADRYGVLFTKLSAQFNVNYGKAKHWKVQDLRELVNEAYSIYAAMHLALNVYNEKFSQEGMEFYANLKKLMALLSNVLVASGDVDRQRVAHIEVHDDLNRKVADFIAGAGYRNPPRNLHSDELAFLSLLHAENARFVTDQHITNALFELRDMDAFAMAVSYCNNLYNITTGLRRQTTRKRARAIPLQLLAPPKFTFGNLTYLRCLLIYTFKGIHTPIPVEGMVPAIIDTMFVPDRRFLEELEDRRMRFDTRLTPKTDFKAVVSSLYGSNVYVELVERHCGLRKIALLANPNAACYEFLVLCRSDLVLHVDNGSSAVLFNYNAVGLSTGKPKIGDITNKCNFLVKHLSEQFGAASSRSSRPELNFHGTSLGGHFVGKMRMHAGPARQNEYVVFHKTFGDLKRLSVALVGRLVEPFLPLYSMDSNVVDDFVKIAANKVLVVDINDEIIPLSCSLACEVARRQTMPGVGKLTNAFLDYKYKTLQLLTDSFKTGAAASEAARSAAFAKMRLVKETLAVVGRGLNATGETLIKMLETEKQDSTKQELASANEFFTRMVMYGSLPGNALPHTGAQGKALVDMFDVLSRLNLRTNYFTAYAGGAGSPHAGPENAKYVSVPPKVAMYFSLFLDEVPSEGSELDRESSVERPSTRSSESSSTSSSTKTAAFAGRRVVFTGGEYYVDFAGAGAGAAEEAHLLDCLKRDLRKFGHSASKYRLTPLKLLAYLRLYALLNAFAALLHLAELGNSQFGQVLAGDTDAVDAELRPLYELCVNFLFNVVQVLIEEPFGVGFATENLQDEEFFLHRKKFRHEYRKFGVAIPQFIGHCLQNPPQDAAILSALVRNM